MMWTEVILILTLVLLAASLGVNYYFVKYLSHFLNQIQTVKGIEVRTLENGEVAPLFRTYNEKGEKVVLKDLFGEKKTLLLFIKTGCPICQTLLPHLKEITNHYDLHLLLINSDNNNDDKDITAQLHDHISYIRAPQIAQAYFLRQYPYAVLLDAEGKVELHSRLANTNSLWNVLVNEKTLVS